MSDLDVDAAPMTPTECGKVSEYSVLDSDSDSDPRLDVDFRYDIRVVDADTGDLHCILSGLTVDDDMVHIRNRIWFHMQRELWDAHTWLHGQFGIIDMQLLYRDTSLESMNRVVCDLGGLISSVLVSVYFTELSADTDSTWMPATPHIKRPRSV